MNDIFRKTLGGLTREYYIRQLFFGVLLSALMLFMSSNGDIENIKIKMIIFVLISTFLYPYARFIYESIIDFIIGDNIFIHNAMFMLIFKFITMFLCWAFAIFIAPVGLLYLYYVNSKK